MNNCIICGENLTDLEIAVNMDFHAKCAPNVIKEAWELLEKQNNSYCDCFCHKTIDENMAVHDFACGCDLKEKPCKVKEVSKK